jgi:hypothetical protein
VEVHRANSLNVARRNRLRYRVLTVIQETHILFPTRVCARIDQVEISLVQVIVCVATDTPNFGFLGRKDNEE